MTEKWYENFKYVENKFDKKEIGFNNEMELEIKCGRDMWNEEYREKHGMVNWLDCEIVRVMECFGE